MALDVYLLKVAYAAAGEFMENVLAYEASVTGSTTPEADALELCTGWESTVLPTLLPLWAPETVLLGLRASRVNNTGGPSAVLLGNGSQVGTGPAGLDDTRTAAVFSFDYYDTLAATPRWRTGRLFMGGVYEGAMKDNLWSATYITNATTFVGALAGPVGSPVNFNSGIWSRKHKQIQGVATPNWELSPAIGGLKRRIMPHV